MPYDDIVDVDARFRLRNGRTRTFRVIRVPVCKDLPGGGWEVVDLWFATNLSEDLFSAEQVALLYRLRWQVEQLFRTLKMVGRLDHLRTANTHVIHAFIFATLLGMALSDNICAWMRRTWPNVEPSPYRVASLVLRFLPRIIDAMGTKKQRKILSEFENALWKEGTNPNPGRPYRSNRYAKEIPLAA